MSTRVEYPAGRRFRAAPAEAGSASNDAIVARALTPDEMDRFIARSEATASAERRGTWRRRRNIRTPLSRPTQRKPRGLDS